jgi:uncharacterized protein (UPF0276 family)
MSEGAFYREIVERTGCDLLLDVANVYANALNGVSHRASSSRLSRSIASR